MLTRSGAQNSVICTAADLSELDQTAIHIGGYLRGTRTDVVRTFGDRLVRPSGIVPGRQQIADLGQSRRALRDRTWCPLCSTRSAA